MDLIVVERADTVSGPDGHLWLRRSGYFREIVGYSEAIDLLSDPRAHARFVEIFEGIGITTGPLWEAAASSLLSLNGEEHRRLRSVIAGQFTPRAVERVRPIAREAAHRLITPFEAAGGCEFVGEFAEPYVTTSTCHFVGFPESDVLALWQAVKSIGHAMKDMANRIDELDQGLALLDYAKSALDERRARPNDDVLTVISDAVTSGSLPEPVALGMITTLLSAGLEPTINQLGIVIEELATRPRIWDAIADGAVTPTSAVEAVLRLHSTNQGAVRRVAETFEYQGLRFNDGETVLVGLATANRDPRAFTQPDQLQIDTDRSQHLAFGFGPHFCLGAALARVQLQEALFALAQRVTCPVITEIEEHEGGGLVGPSRLLVSFSSRESDSRAGSRN